MDLALTQPNGVPGNPTTSDSQYILVKSLSGMVSKYQKADFSSRICIMRNTTKLERHCPVSMVHIL
jgi:hypothetical protein